ncbi:MAG: hypothetical protein WCC60_14835 [Ilumatobacteraceae bacterium]
MHLLPRLRLLLARRPWIYWFLVGCCACVAWLAMASAADDAAQERSSWGTTRRVWVTHDVVTAGSRVDAVALDYPVAMVPAAALTAAPDGVAAHSLAAGEVLVHGDIAGDDGLTPDGWLVFAVPAEGGPALAAGDVVTVFGSGRQWCDGTVVGASVGEGSAEVAVPPDCAASMSAQLALHAVTLARSP